MLWQRMREIILHRWSGRQATNNQYRAYVLNDSGHIMDVAQVEANGDEDATRQAEHLRKGFDKEVWQQERKVAVLKAIR